MLASYGILTLHCNLQYAYRFATNVQLCKCLGLAIINSVVSSTCQLRKLLFPSTCWMKMAFMLNCSVDYTELTHTLKDHTAMHKHPSKYHLSIPQVISMAPFLQHIFIHLPGYINSLRELHVTFLYIVLSLHFFVCIYTLWVYTSY